MTILPGIDGLADVNRLAPDGCCPPSLCNLDPCAIICNFISSLPRGPLWDRAKAEAIDRRATTAVGCPSLACETGCTSVVDHAVYTAARLIDALWGALYPALRESDPYSAHDTLDLWLDRLGWKDCYDCACRECASLDNLSPLEIANGVDVTCAAPNYPDELRLAVKRGIVAALDRLSMVPRRNLAAVNFVIAPLAARIEYVSFVDLSLDPARCNNDDGTTLCTPIVPVLRQYRYSISPIGTTMPKAMKSNCFDPRFRQTMSGPLNVETGAPEGVDLIQSYYEPSVSNGDPVGLPVRLYPGVMAAECVARAMMPPGEKIKLVLTV